jgi:hypothetical protein
MEQPNLEKTAHSAAIPAPQTLKQCTQALRPIVWVYTPLKNPPDRIHQIISIMTNISIEINTFDTTPSIFPAGMSIQMAGGLKSGKRTI